MNSIIKPCQNGNVTFLDYRSKLYYGQFKYKIHIHSPGIRLCRNINMTMKQYRIAVLRSYYGNEIWFENAEESYVTHRGYLLDIENLKISLGKNVKVRREWDSISIFLNDVEVVKNYTVANRDVITTYESVITDAEDVIYFSKPPKHRYRAYINRNPNRENIDQIQEFVNKYAEKIKVSGSLKRLLFKNPLLFYYYNGCGSFDFDDERLITVLNLSISGAVKKVCELRQLKS